MKMFLNLLSMMAVLICITACNGVMGGAADGSGKENALAPAQLSDMFIAELEEPALREESDIGASGDKKPSEVNEVEITKPGNYDENVVAAASSKDMLKLAACKQQLKLERMTQKLHVDFGLSESRSMEVARLTSKLSSAPKYSMTDKDYDAFSSQIFGSSITEFQHAAELAAQGESHELNALLEKAARVNGIEPEQAERIMKTLLSEQ